MAIDIENRPTRRDALLDLLAQARSLVERWGAGLGPEQQAELGRFERWSAKDILVHIANWHGQLALALELRGQNQPVPDLWHETNEQNARLFEQNRDVPWADAWARTGQAYARLQTQVERLDEADLARIDDFAWREGKPLWRTIAGNGYHHPCAHVAQYLVERSDFEAALQIFEQIAAAMSRLDSSPQGRGEASYNLACACALAGRPEAALAHLQQALTLAPDLAKWAGEDPDLVSLRDRPEYQAILG